MEHLRDTSGTLTFVSNIRTSTAIFPRRSRMERSSESSLQVTVAISCVATTFVLFCFVLLFVDMYADRSVSFYISPSKLFIDFY